MTYTEAVEKAKQGFVIKREISDWVDKLLVYQPKTTPLALCTINALKSMGKFNIQTEEQFWLLTFDSVISGFKAKVYIPPDEDINANDWIYFDSVDVCISNNVLVQSESICANIR